MKQYNLRHIISRIIYFFYHISLFIEILTPASSLCLIPATVTQLLHAYMRSPIISHTSFFFFFFLDLWLFLFICLGLCPVGSHIPWNEVPARTVPAGAPVLIILSYLWHFCTEAFSRLCIFITIWHDWLTISAWFTVYPDHLWRMVPMNLFPYLVIISGTNVL